MEKIENKKINWFPGHMFKAKKEIQENLKTVDAIIEVIDSRCALTSHNKMLEEIVANKPRLLLFSKYDLVEKEELAPFINYYTNKGYRSMALNIHTPNAKSKVIKEIETMCTPILEKYKQKGMHKILRVMIIGMPNVGKSSLINQIAKKKKLVVGNRPGVTKKQQIIKIGDSIELVDTPGVLIPKIEHLHEGYNLILNSLIKDEIVELEEVALYLLKYLIEYRPKELIRRYKIVADIENLVVDMSPFEIEELYSAIGKSIGGYSKSLGPDYYKISVRIINDYRSQKFGKIILDRI